MQLHIHHNTRNVQEIATSNVAALVTPNKQMSCNIIPMSLAGLVTEDSKIENWPYIYRH